MAKSEKKEHRNKIKEEAGDVSTVSAADVSIAVTDVDDKRVRLRYL